jgi:putative flavoprotein involved in K+ transport
MSSRYSVLIVGAGPAGIGVAAALKRCGVENFLIVDAREPGASFAAWPGEMRMITPSFYSNPFGHLDLNSVDPETSPADFLRTQHPTGKEYALYLQAVVAHHQLPVRGGVKVTEIQRDEDGFLVMTESGLLRAKMVVWATGQFFYPNERGFPGAEHCRHSSAVKDWRSLAGSEFTIIGGYESGIDAAVTLCEFGKNVRLLSRGEPWSVDSPDPSRSLSPRTLDRVRSLLGRPGAGRLELVGNEDIRRVEKGADGWTLHAQNGGTTVSRTQPILASGYAGGFALVGELFDHREGRPVFHESCDESTITPGLFYSGPELAHRGSLFCFIYKFRSRFGLIAREIAERLGVMGVEKSLEIYATAGLMNEDLDCCTSCECALEPVGESGSDRGEMLEAARHSLAEI